MKFFYSGDGAILPEEVLPVAISEDDDTGGADIMLTFADFYNENRPEEPTPTKRFRDLMDSRTKTPEELFPLAATGESILHKDSPEGEEGHFAR